jgi:hypothetical protein
MTRLIFTTLLFSLFHWAIFAQTLVLEGNYTGKNLYVQNPFSSDGVGFCITEVEVNGKTTATNTTTSAFEIKLDFLKVGTPVKIVIHHKEGCHPKVLNTPMHGNGNNTSISFSSISLDSTGLLQWNTENEYGKLPFLVEQYRWNKWIKVGEVDGLGTSGQNHYSFQVKFHPGENKFRIKQIDLIRKPRISKPISIVIGNEPIGCFDLTEGEEIAFSEVTLYEIYDAFGNILMKGESDKVDIRKLKKGAYYLNYGNQSRKFLKK